MAPPPAVWPTTTEISPGLIAAHARRAHRLRLRAMRRAITRALRRIAGLISAR